MKIIAVLEDDIRTGGGFNQSLNAILQMRRICDGRFDFEVFATHEANVDLLRDQGIRTQAVSISFLDKLLSHLSLYAWWNRLQSKMKLLSPIEKKLRRGGCDLVYFVKQSELSLALQTLNFITTLFDLCHRDAPEFPEVRQYGQFQERESYFNTHLTGALVVIADSPALADNASARYGVDRERLLPMPFAPAPFLDTKAAIGKDEVIRKYDLPEGYLFYPAQFWAHKNHIRIVEALVILRLRGNKPHVVFAGGDKGNRRHVEEAIRKNALQAQVHVLGFVPADEMRGLYLGCGAVVMPTYFGPTNLPPLEAWTMGRPLIYTSYFRDQTGDAAICVDPDDAEDLATAMETCTRPDVSERLIRLGVLQLSKVEQQRAAAEQQLLRHLERFALRRKCWE
ncbi:MAG TPA: glycosyltransferase [Burkholderiales bacterium]|nr:glycosyltransferase [Burkholderiales bacterium]